MVSIGRWNWANDHWEEKYFGRYGEREDRIEWRFFKGEEVVGELEGEEFGREGVGELEWRREVVGIGRVGVGWFVIVCVVGGVWSSGPVKLKTWMVPLSLATQTLVACSLNAIL